MPTWVLLSILAPAILTVVNFTDKYILERQIKDYRGFAIFSAIVGLTAGALLWVATGFPTLPLTDGLLVVLTGVLAVFGTALYFQVLSKEETSKVIFLLQLTPVMVLALSVLFLGDKLSLRAFAGFVLIRYFVFDKSNEYGKLKVISSPGASIFINNTIIGKTPYDDKYKVGEYLLKLIPEGTATETASWNGKINIYKNSYIYDNVIMDMIKKKKAIRKQISRRLEDLREFKNLTVGISSWSRYVREGLGMSY